MLVLGVDPSSKASYGALYDDTRIVAAGKLELHDKQLCVGGTWRLYIALSAAVIETVESASGIYSRDGKPVRSRAAAVLETDRAGWRYAEQLRQAGVRVWTPTRREILRQAGYQPIRNGKADSYVTFMLHFRRMLECSTHPVSGRITVLQPAYLRNVNARDAAMAALFNWQSPVNASWEYRPEAQAA